MQEAEIQVSTESGEPEIKKDNDNIVVESNEGEIKAPEKDKKDAEPKESVAPEAPKKKRPGPIQRENERLKRELEATRQAPNRELEELKSRLDSFAPPKQATQPIDPKAPKIEDYPNALEFIEAKQRYNFTQFNEQQEQTKLVENFDIQAVDLEEKHPDFRQKVEGLLKSGLATPDMTKAVLKSGMSAEITYHLANSQQDLLILRGYPKEQLPVAIKKLENFLKNKPQPEPLKQTQAKPPIKPIGKQAATSSKGFEGLTEAEFESMSQKEKERRMAPIKRR